AATVWDALEESESRHELDTYVQTEAYHTAIALLEEHNYCILTGIPGIGKTTLARVLATHLDSKGFEIVYARDNIAQAFDQLRREQPQVIFYDDFLGRTSRSERLGKNEDRDITQLLRF